MKRNIPFGGDLGSEFSWCMDERGGPRQYAGPEELEELDKASDQAWQSFERPLSVSTPKGMQRFGEELDAIVWGDIPDILPKEIRESSGRDNPSTYAGRRCLEWELKQAVLGGEIHS